MLSLFVIAVDAERGCPEEGLVLPSVGGFPTFRGFSDSLPLFKEILLEKGSVGHCCQGQPTIKGDKVLELN